ncbi:MAG: TolC family protein [Proteobacteria bacterium]|nr:TolC family protein [Pseudomonadota bacterium]NDC25223.1 TolC family protein [Pseudomonadota bacterium]NDD05065.1 TolC family protein [Pseudomonadota bacterium]
MNARTSFFNKTPWIFIGIFLVFSSPHRLIATPDPAAAAQVPPLTFETLLKNTLSNNGMIQESAQDIEVARAQLDRARAAFWPKASVGILGAPIFEETGDALHSQSNLNKWGPFFRGSVEFAQPLYTFGMLGNYEKAATSQISAKTELTQAKANEVLLQAKEFYYGYLMACEFQKLLEDLSSFLKEAVESAEDSLKDPEKKGTVKPHDLYQLKTALDDLEQKALYADAAKKTAEKALGWISGLQFTQVTNKSLEAEKYQKKTLEEYVQLAKGTRPELKALPAGIQAYEALADAKQAQDYPIVFVGGFGELNWSPVRTRQNSQFAFDPFNRPQGGFGVGLKFDLEFKRHTAEAQEQRAQAMKLKATQTYAAPGIELQVKKSFFELEQAEKGLEVASRRKETAKKWFISSSMGWSIGVTPAKDLLEALEGHGMARKNYIETLYSFNLALAKLTQAVGKEVTELSY